jgi:hypothetical protein
MTRNLASALTIAATAAAIASMAIIAAGDARADDITLEAAASPARWEARRADLLHAVPGVPGDADRQARAPTDATAGVRARIAKLEIFDDCEVAIRIETGH